MGSMFGTTQPYDDIVEFFRAGFGYVLNWIRLIGSGLALIVITVIAFRYITSPPGARPELRKSFQAYFVGAVVFLGASNLIYYAMQLVTNILQDLLIE